LRFLDRTIPVRFGCGSWFAALDAKSGKIMASSIAGIEP